MNELALFAGAGGGILGGKLLGWRTVCAVEFDPHARNVLVARQNDGCLEPFPIWDDVRSFDGKPWRGIVDVVSGGFPCQDISCAGSGKGIKGERSGLWSEMRRIIGEVRPKHVFVENSPMLIIRGIGVVLGDFSEMGYNAKWGIISAKSTGAIHKRERIWILASDPLQSGLQRKIQYSFGNCQTSYESPIQGYPLVHPEWTNLLTSDKKLRANDGVANWMDRMSRIGNGQVPAVVRLAWHVLCQQNGQKKV